MSMLAGPRRKQRVINLRAKNSEWSNDKNKFGQKMLEKMGWSEGKGLGAKENGIVEHVVAKYKNDEKGLGFVDKNDQWTKHEDDFNALLANLSNTTENEDGLHSGNSLEVKSKKSKARIHYHKYTRGKDLSRYSEKDLANIFGKKSLKNKDTDDTKEPIEEVQSKEQVFTDKGSMDDYFKNKLALKAKAKLNTGDYDCESDVMDYGFRGFSNIQDNEEHKNDFQEFSHDDINSCNENLKKDSKSEICEINKSKKKKKSKCSHDASQEESEDVDLEKNNCEMIVENEQNYKTAKKSYSNGVDESSSKKNKKRKKEKKSKDFLSDQIYSEVVDHSEPIQKKKKKKNKSLL